MNQLAVGPDLEPRLGRATIGPVASAVDIVVEDTDYDHGGVQDRNETLGGKDHLVGAVTADTVYRITRDRLKLGRISLVLVDLRARRERIADSQDSIGGKRLYRSRVHANSILAGDQRARQIRAVSPAQERVMF
jgi:hypothetical protein